MSLTAPRPTKPLNSFEAPDPKKDEGKVKRLYNKTGKHARDPEFWLKGGMNPGKVDND